MKKIANRKTVLLIIGISLICSAFFYYVSSNVERTSFGILNEDVLIRVPTNDLPADTLYITQERREYQQGQLTLIIPAIEVDTLVGSSTDSGDLKEMAGLYEFSQLPSNGNVNVSVAGHRDIHNKVFSSLNKLQDNDYAYLIYNNYVFRYLYKDTKIVKPKEWDVIKPQGFSCLTLTTCDPVGTSLNRMIVRMELVDIQIFNEQYQFAINTSTLS